MEKTERTLGIVGLTLKRIEMADKGEGEKLRSQAQNIILLMNSGASESAGMTCVIGRVFDRPSLRCNAHALLAEKGSIWAQIAATTTNMSPTEMDTEACTQVKHNQSRKNSTPLRTPLRSRMP